MPHGRVYAAGLNEDLRDRLCRAAQGRWSVVESLPADVIVVSTSDDLRLRIAQIRRGSPHTPILVVGGAADATPEAAEAGAQAHVPVTDPEAISAALRMLLDTIHRYAAVHPLTGLPGSPAIERELQRRFPERGQMGCVQFDIDHFKPFNDACGFQRGDEMIVGLKHLIEESAAVHDPVDFFLGHIGGDDFVLVATPAVAEAVAREVVSGFETLCTRLVDDSHREQGYIETLSRTGETRRFPLPTITAVMVTNEASDVRHPGQVSAILAEMKAHVKTKGGSNFFRDRRNHHDPEESLARKPK